MIRKLLLAGVSVITLFCSNGMAEKVYNESGGLVIMEFENTESSYGQWVKETSLSGYNGSGYLRFTGNDYTGGNPASPLKYNFKINTGGTYIIEIHCAKKLVDGRTDWANDAYIRVIGDFESSSKTLYDIPDTIASAHMLKNDLKYYGGAINAWEWAGGDDSSSQSKGRLDPGGKMNKRQAVYQFKAGETYTLVVSGRSKDFRIDRIAFRKTGASVNLNGSESSNFTGSIPSTDSCDKTVAFGNFNAESHPGNDAIIKDNGSTVGSITTDSWIRFNSFNFGVFEGGCIDLQASTPNEGGYIELRTDSATGPLLGTVRVRTTDGWAGWTIFSGNVSAVSGVKDLYFVFKGGSGSLFNLNTFSFHSGEEVQEKQATPPINPPLGRIAYVADGNSPDPDDISATAAALAMLRAAGLDDRLVHLSHCCDLVKADNISVAQEEARYVKMQTACDGTRDRWGGFEGLTFWNCKTQQSATITDLKNAINASSASDPLWIIEAGEPDIIGYALRQADSTKRQYVKLITHHPVNDSSGDYINFSEIKNNVGEVVRVPDQNGASFANINEGLQRALWAFYWARDHADPRINWLWEQVLVCESDGVVGFQDGKCDISDSGMMLYWITGANVNDGYHTGNMNDVIDLLLNSAANPEHGLVAHWPLDEGSGTTLTNAANSSYTAEIKNGATWGSDATRDSYVSFDGIDDRISTTFKYALADTNVFTWTWWANKQAPAGEKEGSIMVGNRYPERSSPKYGFIKMTPQGAQFANCATAGEIDHYDYDDVAIDGWHHYAMVKDGTSYRWYVDGVAQSSTNLSYSETVNIPFMIGGDEGGSTNEFFQGYIDDVVLYKSALSSSDVDNVMNGKYDLTVMLTTLGTPVDSTDGTAWSDGLPAHGGANYVVPATGNLRSETGTSTFPGDKLSVEAGGRFQVLALDGSDEVTTVDNLILSGGASFADGEVAQLAAGTGTDAINVLDGSITQSNYTQLITYGSSNRGLKVLSEISGSGKLQAAGGATVTMANAANTFSGTWEVEAETTLVFNNIGAVGSADIEVHEGGKLQISGSWNAGATLTVSDTATTQVDLGIYTWTVSGLLLGGTSVDDGLYTAADLNALGDAVFTGTGTLRVGTRSPDEPIAHWRLDEASGTVAMDSTGSGYTGTIENGATWGSDATRDSYVSFDGSNDRIATTFTYALADTDNFTWAWWASSARPSTDTTQKGSIMVGNRYPERTEPKYGFIKFTPTETQFANHAEAGDIEHFVYTDVAQGGWHHYAMVKTGTSCQWYVDGVAQGTPVTINYNETVPIPFLIGGDDDGSGTKVNEHFQGFIDDVVLYDKALSSIQVGNVQNGLYVNPSVDTAPTLSSIEDQTIFGGTDTGPLAFTIGDSHTAAADLTLSKISSDTTLVPEANIVFGGSDANRTVTVTPADGESGDATISIVVRDGTFSTTNAFLLTVFPEGSEYVSITNNVAGTTTWVCPTGVTSIQVECWGGGGAGGSSATTGGARVYVGGGGGAGGAYAKKVSVPVTPGNFYSLTIGDAAVAVDPATASTGDRVNGADISFTGDSGETVLAKGGQGGECVINPAISTGGAGGIGSTTGCDSDGVGSVFAGGNGYTPLTKGGSGGGGAGNSANGGDAYLSDAGDPDSATLPGAGGLDGGGEGGLGAPGVDNGGNASSPGGGGGGARTGKYIASSGADLQKIGGAGGLGQIIITYVQLPAGELPMLDHELNGGDMVFNWTGSGFKVQSRTNLTEGAWEDYPEGDTPPVIVTPTNGTAFFRLIEQ